MPSRAEADAAYATAWGPHQGIVVVQQTPHGRTTWTTINGLPSKVTFLGRLWLRIKYPLTRPYYSLGRNPQETDPDKIKFLMQNAKSLQQQLDDLPLTYNMLGRNVVAGVAGTSNQLSGALWHSIDIYPTPVFAPGFDIDLPSDYSVPQY